MHQVAFLRTVFLALAIAPLIGNEARAGIEFDGTYAVTYSGTVTYSGPTTKYYDENGFLVEIRDEPYFAVYDVADEMTGTVENGTITGIPGAGTVSDAGVVNGYLQFPGGDIWEFEGTATLLETGGVEAQGTWTHYSINEFLDVVEGFGTWTATRISTDLIADSFSWNAEKSGYDLTYEVAEAPLEVETQIGLYWATGETVDSIIDIDAPAYSKTIDKQVGSYDLFVALDDIKPPPKKNAVGITKATHLLMALNPRKIIVETDYSNNVFALKRGLNIDEFIKQYKKIAPLDGTVEVNLRTLLTFMQNDPSIHFEQDVRQAAYMLATARGECNYLPRYEKYSGISAFIYFERKYGYLTRKGKELGNTKLGDGYLYRGRGYVQITGKKNYAKFDFFLGVDLVADPDLALQPVIAYDILSFGLFDGMFTGVGLDRYITDTGTDYRNARRVVNKLDKATLFQGYALQFEKVLKASVIGF